MLRHFIHFYTRLKYLCHKRPPFRIVIPFRTFSQIQTHRLNSAPPSSYRNTSYRPSPSFLSNWPPRPRAQPGAKLLGASASNQRGKLEPFHPLPSRLSTAERPNTRASTKSSWAERGNESSSPSNSLPAR